MSNSIGWIIGVIILLLVIAGGAFLWVENNSNTTRASIKTNLPIGE
ncbi:hypothetical protein KW782_03300 [Candidatus Parcubacteria bacterium]|nr:hypothetical protein [Candidatus Parcubacteria bacterium]